VHNARKQSDVKAVGQKHTVPGLQAELSRWFTGHEAVRRSRRGGRLRRFRPGVLLNDVLLSLSAFLCYNQVGRSSYSDL